jgi:methylenetetrahydrofolate dehydrogenase (NADP+)/methenyltetrahydrofolate cyclohydrolase
MTRIDGKAIAARLRERLSRDIAGFAARHGRAPGLSVVLVGDDPASALYVRNKEKAAREVGIAGAVYRLPGSASEGDILARVEALNADSAVDGILVQLPLPDGARADRIIERLDPSKDVDGLHPLNVGALWEGRPRLLPCTPRGCMRLLSESGVPLLGCRAIVVGRSNLVGKPVAGLLLLEHATVTIAHSRTADLPALCREADVLVAAVGRARMIHGDWVKPGAVVLDVGINRDQDGKLCGDVDFESAEAVASAITPVPGGVGPMTIAMLLENTLIAARARAGETG